MKRITFLLLAGALGLTLGTAWALESSEVAVITTRSAEDSIRRTHVWFAEPEGEIWLEAGTPENPWFIDIATESMVRFETDRHKGEFRASVVESPDGHTKIRSLLREKYGLRDAWGTLLFDTQRSRAVRLVPIPTKQAETDPS